MITRIVRPSVVLLWVLLFGFLQVDSARGEPLVTPAPDLYNIFSDANRIARIRITARDPVYLGLSLPGEPICGYVLTAEVIDALKGGGGAFKFFLPTDSDFQGIGRDYIVIAFMHPSLSHDQEVAIWGLADRDTTRVLRRLNCVMEYPEYVAAKYQTLWAFAKDGETRFGGEWVLTALRNDGLFCGYRAEEVVPDDIELRQWESPDKHLVHAVRWDDLRNTFNKILQGDMNAALSLCHHR
jgi:hypothetical protein